MSDAPVLAAAAGAAGTLMLLLAALRLKSLRRQTLRTLSAWTEVPHHRAVPVLTVLAGGAALCLSNATAPEAVSPSVAHIVDTPPYDLLQSAPGASAPEAPFPGGGFPIDEARRDRALESLRTFASRMEGKREMIASLGQEENAAAPETTGGLPDVDTMMERLRERLKSRPDDVKGWTTLGWAYANMGKYQDAVSAYETALKLDTGNEDIKSALADVRGKASADAAGTDQNKR